MDWSENDNSIVYMNCAATSLRRPEEVGIAVKEAILNMGNAGRSASGSSLEAGKAVLRLREKIAAFFGFSHPERVIFTANVTQALNMVLFGLLDKGDHVIATDTEHNAVLRPLHVLQSTGIVEVDYLKADERGRLNPDDLYELIRPNTGMVIAAHASNVTGNVTDIESIGKIAGERNIVFCVDAAQTAGVMDIDVEKQNIDILCFTGHKSLMGPTGTGGCLISERVDIRPLLHGGTGILSKDAAQPRIYPERLEAGTLNIHGLAGLSAAMDFLGSVGIAKIQAHENMLLQRFLQGIKDIPQIRLYGDFENAHTPVVLLNLPRITSNELADVLAQEYRIEVRAGLHCAPRIHEALGTGGSGAVRFSFGYFTTEAEVDYAIKALREISDALLHV